MIALLSNILLDGYKQSSYHKKIRLQIHVGTSYKGRRQVAIKMCKNTLLNYSFYSFPSAINFRPSEVASFKRRKNLRFMSGCSGFS